MKRIREVKWPWNSETQSGFINPLKVDGLRVKARFLALLFIDDNLCLYFEEDEGDTIGRPRHFTIFHSHNRLFSANLDGCEYVASAPIHGGRWVAHVYEVRTQAALGAFTNLIQVGQSSERLARAARGGKA